MKVLFALLFSIISGNVLTGQYNFSRTTYTFKSSERISISFSYAAIDGMNMNGPVRRPSKSALSIVSDRNKSINSAIDSNYVDFGEIDRKDCGIDSFSFSFLSLGTAADVMNSAIWQEYAEDDGNSIVIHFGDQYKQGSFCLTNDNDGEIDYASLQAITIIIEDELDPPMGHMTIVHSNDVPSGYFQSTLANDATEVTFFNDFGNKHGSIGVANSASTFLNNDPMFLIAFDGLDMSFATQSSSNSLKERMRIRNEGYIGIGTSVPSSMLHITKNGNAGDNINLKLEEYGGVKGLGMEISNGRALFHSLSNGDITSSIDDGLELDLMGGGSFNPILDGVMSLGNSGNRWNTVWATNGIIATSDLRLKKRVTNLRYDLSTILKLRPVSFYWKNKLDNEKKIGFIAQELLDIIPEVVSTSSDSGNLGVNYSELIPLLVKGIQDQQEVIENLKKEMASIKKMVNDMAN